MLDALIEIIPPLRNSLMNDREKRLIMVVILLSLPITIFMISFTVAYFAVSADFENRAEEIYEQKGIRLAPVQRTVRYTEIEREAMYLLFTRAFRQNNFEYAEEIAKKLMLNDSTDNLAKYFTAKLKIENEKFAEANEILQVLQTRNFMPDSVKTLLISVVSFSELPKFIGDTVSLSATQLAKIGERYLAAGNNDASVFFRKALAKDSSNVEALLQTARWYMQSRNFVPAENLLRRALAIDSTSARVLGRYAMLLHETGRAQSARIFYRKAIARNPFDFNLAFNLGELYLSSLNDGRNAKIFFQRAIELSPGTWQSHFKLGLIYLEENQTDSAIIHFRTANEQSPGNLRIMHLLAAAFERNGERENAVRVYDRILRIDPLDAIALYKSRLLRQR